MKSNYQQGWNSVSWAREDLSSSLGLEIDENVGIELQSQKLTKCG